MKKANVISYLLLFITIFLWASAFIGIRIGLRGYSPGTLALFRFLVASIAIIPIYFKYRSPFPFSWTALIGLLFLGVFGIGVYHFSLNYGELTVSAGMASFIVGLSPVFSVILALLFLKEKLFFLGWIGMAISFLGIVMIAFSQGGSSSFHLGILSVLVASLVSGAYAVVQKHVLKRIKAIECASLIIWIGAASLLVFLPGLPSALKHAPLSSTLAVIYLGVFPGAIAYLTWGMALHSLSVTKASSALYAMPLLSTFLGWILLNETASLLSLAGGLLALAGSFIVQHKHKKDRERSSFIAAN